MSDPVKAKLAPEPDDGLGGVVVSVVSGAAVSIVHVYEAGVASTLPTESIARTWNVCWPAVRPT